jgi:hypothetical protein
MAAGDPALRERSLNVRSVEGPSEIDISFEGAAYVVFVEAKLGSDVSLATTYDPQRDQIARNLDCVLDVCGSRRPLFWMFVRDRNPSRDYMRLMERYRSPAELCRALPHRPASQLGELSETLAIVTWAELLSIVEDTDSDVYRELERRVTA